MFPSLLFSLFHWRTNWPRIQLEKPYPFIPLITRTNTVIAHQSTISTSYCFLKAVFHVWESALQPLNHNKKRKIKGPVWKPISSNFLSILNILNTFFHLHIYQKHPNNITQTSLFLLSSSFFFFFLSFYIYIYIYIYIYFCWVNITILLVSLSKSIFVIPTYFAYEVAGIGDKLLKIREYKGNN